MDRRVVGLSIPLLLLLPGLAEAQERDCEYEQGPAGRAEQVQIDGELVLILHDPFAVNCGDGTQLRASSGRINRSRGEHHLVGSVFFQDPERMLTADEATYTTAAARLWARGDVVLTDLAEGSTLRGPEIEYFRPTEQRPEAEIVATQRPQLTLASRAVEGPTEPLQLVADRVTIVGDDDLSAFGSVVITRSDLHATSEEARFNQAAETFELRRDARVRSEGQELTGDVIQAQLNDGSLEHVQARTDASLVGEDLRVAAPDIQIFLVNEVLERVVARAPASSNGEAERAIALARDFRIEADSIDASFIDERIDNVVAIGDARGETLPTEATPPSPSAEDLAATDDGVPVERTEVAEAADSADAAGRAEASLAFTERDWIRGDTIIGYFAPVPASDVAPDAGGAADVDVELNRLIARGSAQSLYRLWNQEQDAAAADGRPNINYLVGREIELDFAEGELSVAHVEGLQRGLYLDAIPDAAPADGAAEPPPAEPSR